MALCNRGLLVAVTILYLSFASFPSSSVTSIHEQDIWQDLDKFTTYQPGKTYEGLSNVKRYLHEIGYNIGNTPPSNFDDKFDQDMVSAIKIYQKNYNLKLTGKLDHNTLQRLMTRGCGVHTVSHYKFFGTQVRWPQGTTLLPYIYYPDPRFDSDFKNAVSKAFDSWEKVTGFKFEETFSNGTAKIKIQFESGGRHFHYNPYIVTWAVAISPPVGRFFLNGNVTWVSSGDFTNIKELDAVDVETVAVHEIGHLLGLDHSDDKSAVMYHAVNGHSRKVNLAQDDINGIKTLYNIP